jgi:hypothetical protein
MTFSNKNVGLPFRFDVTFTLVFETGNDTMSLYRLFWIGSDDHIQRADAVDCASDRDACAVAKERMGGFPAVEVWHLATRVARITLDTPPKA